MALHFKKFYPWVKLPVIVNGPMLVVAGPEMVAEVTRAGGLGFMAAGENLKLADENLTTAGKLLSKLNLPMDRLPIGLGIQCFKAKPDDFVDILKKHKPVAVWLFAVHNVKDDYFTWTRAVRAVCDAQIWIQINSVTDAITLAEHVKPDVLVMQGSDAGGHGAEKAAGIVSLLPETADAVSIPLIAAGGIADGRGVAAAVALGAVGATMGTRFLACKEANIANKAYQKAILEAADGGQSTFKDKIYDNMNAAGNIWPVTFNGRGLRNATTKDHDDGVDLEAIRKSFAEAAKTNGGYADDITESRAISWAGTGVGLVKSVDGAAEIVEQARREAIEVLKRVAGEY